MKKFVLGIFTVLGVLLASQTVFADGAIWTTTSSCGTPQNSNHYSVGDHVYINGSNFDANKSYSWDIESTGNPKTTVALGTHLTDGNGNVCFDAYTIKVGDSGEYQVTFDNKHDNYQVGASVTPTPTQGVTPTPTSKITPTPTSGVTATPTPTSGLTPTPTIICNEDHDCVPTPTPTVVPTSAVTPTTPPSDHGDGQSDGRSDGGSSCPQCTQAPIQAVLGASTMADTGTFDSTVMNFVLLGGMLSMGAAAYAKAKNA